MNLDQFGMDTITLAGPLERKLQAIKASGFTQIMLNAAGIAGFPAGEAAAIDVPKTSASKPRATTAFSPAKACTTRRSPPWCGGLYAMGYRGDYSFEVFNDDYRQLPLAIVAERARGSVDWIAGVVSRRVLPSAAHRNSALVPARLSFAADADRRRT